MTQGPVGLVAPERDELISKDQVQGHQEKEEHHFSVEEKNHKAMFLEHVLDASIGFPFQRLLDFHKVKS